jgi:hypothetical protein
LYWGREAKKRSGECAHLGELVVKSDPRAQIVAQEPFGYKSEKSKSTSLVDFFVTTKFQPAGEIVDVFGTLWIGLKRMREENVEIREG